MTSHNYHNLLGNCIDALRGSKELADKFLENDEETKNIIQTLTASYVEENFLKDKGDRALEKLKNDLNDVENVTIDIDALHQKYMDEDQTELIHHRTDIWKDIFSYEDIQEVQRKNERISDANFERVDDSLLCSSVFKPPVDPISKTVIKVPYKNTACGHYFDYETILSYIKERRGKARCPYMGCANINFRAEHLRVDERMKQKVEAYLQSHDDTGDFSGDE